MSNRRNKRVTKARAAKQPKETPPAAMTGVELPAQTTLRTGAGAQDSASPNERPGVPQTAASALTTYDPVKPGSLRATDVRTIDLQQELGTIGLKASSGYIWEEYMPQLRGRAGVRVYQTMDDTDATCGGMLYAIRSALISCELTVKPKDESPEAVAAADFAESLMDDMEFTWQDTFSEILSMMPFGWSYFETVTKRRVGDQLDKRFKSKYTDGAIGIRKLARRSQDSLQRWEISREGDIFGMWQQPITGGATVFLPIEKCLLFRTRIDKNNPEGYSLLRRAYRAWYIKHNIEDYEAIGIERDLAGVPVVEIPNALLTATDPTIRNSYLQIARDLKFNQQAGIVVPSDCYVNADGSLSAQRMVNVKLMSSAGTRAINTGDVLKRWDEQILRSLLADFLMMGGSGGSSKGATGSYAMVESKIKFFYNSLNHLLDMVKSVLNRDLLPRIWDLNGFDKQYLPEFVFADAQGVDMTSLSALITAMGTAGFTLNDDGGATEDYLRGQAGLPVGGSSGEEV